MSDYDELLAQAQKIVEGKPTWKRFIDGTPLSNDVPVWMANFAAAAIRDLQAQLEAERKLAAAKARIAELERDAQRYRWLRNELDANALLTQDGSFFRHQLGMFLHAPLDELDAAIDAAMKEEP